MLTRPVGRILKTIDRRCAVVDGHRGGYLCQFGTALHIQSIEVLIEPDVVSANSLKVRPKVKELLGQRARTKLSKSRGGKEQ